VTNFESSENTMQCNFIYKWAHSVSTCFLKLNSNVVHLGTDSCGPKIGEILRKAWRKARRTQQNKQHSLGNERSQDNIKLYFGDITLPIIQWVWGPLSLGVKRPGREADHSPPSSAEVKEWVKLYLHSPNTPSWRGAKLKHRDNFTFTFS
jgi:hypothetical protein